MTKFSAVIEKINSIASDTKEVIFKLSNPINFTAGQYVSITLSALRDLPVTDHSHDFSISSAPEIKDTLAIATRNSQSPFKTGLFRENPGEIIIEGPKGIFALPEDHSPKIVFIAGGIGITPFLSMIRHIVMSKIQIFPTLIFYNHNAGTSPFLSELQSYQGSINLVQVFGRISEQEIIDYQKSAGMDNVLWYVAGPRGMIKSAREILLEHGVIEINLKIEEFSGYE